MQVKSTAKTDTLTPPIDVEVQSCWNMRQKRYIACTIKESNFLGSTDQLITLLWDKKCTRIIMENSRNCRQNIWPEVGVFVAKACLLKNDQNKLPPGRT
jgi:hypothetical protein